MLGVEFSNEEFRFGHFGKSSLGIGYKDFSLSVELKKEAEGLKLLQKAEFCTALFTISMALEQKRLPKE